MREDLDLDLDLEDENEQSQGLSPLMAGLSGEGPSAIRRKPPREKIGEDGPYKYTASELMSLTSQFIWVKLTSRLIFSVFILVCMAIGLWLLKIEKFLTGGVLVAGTLVAIPTMNWIVNRWFSHMTRLGHVAAIIELVRSGKIPDEGVLVFGKKAVTDRFVQAQIFFILDDLLNRATSQLQGYLGNLYGSFSYTFPKSIHGLVKQVLKVAVIYIDECCLAWIFWKGNTQGDFKSVVDGVVIYFQNWQQILIAALKTALVSLLVVWGGAFVIFLIFSPFVTGVWSLLLFSAVLLILLSIKYAFIDTWVFINMLNSFMQVAPGTDINFDIYNMLCSVSEAFRKLFAKVEKKDLKGVPKGPGTYQDYVRPDRNGMVPGLVQGSGRGGTKGVGTRPGQSIIYCGNCGSKNSAGAKFCGDCGDTL